MHLYIFLRFLRGFFASFLLVYYNILQGNKYAFVYIFRFPRLRTFSVFFSAIYNLHGIHNTYFISDFGVENS